jgi:hypothetical protein
MNQSYMFPSLYSDVDFDGLHSYIILISESLVIAVTAICSFVSTP